MSDWRPQAFCREIGMEWFFPGRTPDWGTPRAICEQCPVFAECLDAAMAEEEAVAAFTGSAARHGMRGGLTPDQRDALASGHLELPPGWTPLSLREAAVTSMLLSGKKPAHVAWTAGVPVEMVHQVAERLRAA